MHKTHDTDTCSGTMRGFAIGLMVGAAAGATVALLYAPKSGARLRRDIGAQVDHAKRRAADLYDDAKETVGDLAARGRKLVEPLGV
jgi:gas vesicle protein